jgi:peptidoglycan/LPS O-acetylase OafA/YrhL
MYGWDLVEGWYPGTLDGWTPGSAAAVLAIAAVSVALASLTYRFIELPAMRRKTRVLLWRPTSEAPAPLVAGAAALHPAAPVQLAEARLHHTPKPTDTP